MYGWWTRITTCWTESVQISKLTEEQEKVKRNNIMRNLEKSKPIINNRNGFRCADDNQVKLVNATFCRNTIKECATCENEVDCVFVWECCGKVQCSKCFYKLFNQPTLVEGECFNFKCSCDENQYIITGEQAPQKILVKKIKLDDKKFSTVTTHSRPTNYVGIVLQEDNGLDHSLKTKLPVFLENIQISLPVAWQNNNFGAVDYLSYSGETEIHNFLVCPGIFEKLRSFWIGKTRTKENYRLSVAFVKQLLSSVYTSDQVIADTIAYLPYYVWNRDVDSALLNDLVDNNVKSIERKRREDLFEWRRNGTIILVAGVMVLAVINEIWCNKPKKIIIQAKPEIAPVNIIIKFPTHFE